jgi:hypothetical protein
LRLSGSDGAGGPCVADDQIAIAAGSIGVVIDSRKMTATGLVKTALHPAAKTCGLEPARDKVREDTSKLPGLLKQINPRTSTQVRSNTTDRRGARVYRMDATLWQGETSIRAETITLDQQKGRSHGDRLGARGARAHTGQRRSVGRTRFDTGRAAIWSRIHPCSLHPRPLEQQEPRRGSDRRDADATQWPSG